MTAAEYVSRWRQEQRRQGLCEWCRKPAKRAASGRILSLCEDHLAHVAARNAARRHGLPVPKRPPVAVITKDMLLHDLQCVAKRLGARRVSMTLYDQEGSFCAKVLLDRRIKQTWASLCVEAGLLPTFRGCRGIDVQPCTRCGVRPVNIYLGREVTLCRTCRQVVRKRTVELRGDTC